MLISMPPVPCQHFGGGLLPPLGTHLSFLHSSRPRETPEQALWALRSKRATAWSRMRGSEGSEALWEFTFPSAGTAHGWNFPPPTPNHPQLCKQISASRRKVALHKPLAEERELQELSPARQQDELSKDLFHASPAPFVPKYSAPGFCQRLRSGLLPPPLPTRAYLLTAPGQRLVEK